MICYFQHAEWVALRFVDDSGGDFGHKKKRLPWGDNLFVLTQKNGHFYYACSTKTGTL